MPQRVYTLTLELNEQTLSLFPEALGLGGDDFKNAVVSRLRSAFSFLNGLIQSLAVSEQEIKVTWRAEKPDRMEQIVKLLNRGNHQDGILLLELFLSDEPDNPNLLYNLGMVYSDQNILGRAIELLSKLVDSNPKHVNGRVALGVALLRTGQTEAGVGMLQAVVQLEPDNPWAHSNLGGGLIQLERFAEAGQHLKRATELNPQDQRAWFGYGQALEYAQQTLEADAAYRKVVELDELSELAEYARQSLTKLAQKTYRAQPSAERMDGVMYCLGALETFAKMHPDQIQKIGFEIAFLGTHGLDVNNPKKRYTLKSLPGEFSGLQLLCMEYVAFQQIAPGQDIGFDLSAEYRAALSMFGDKGKK